MQNDKPLTPAQQQMGDKIAAFRLAQQQGIEARNTAIQQWIADNAQAIATKEQFVRVTNYKLNIADQDEAFNRRFEVRSLKPHKDHDGFPIYDAKLFADGKLVAEWIPDTWGGESTWEVTNQAAMDDFAAYAAALPKDDSYGIPMNISVDVLIEDMVARLVTRRQIERGINKGQTLFRKSDDKEGVYRTVATAYSPENRAALALDNPGVIIIIANQDMEGFLDSLLETTPIDLDVPPVL